MTKALRRHHESRVKLRTIRRLKWNWHSEFDAGFKPSQRQVGMLARTPKACSCFMCGNPRKYFNLKTVQERRKFLHVYTKTRSVFICMDQKVVA